MKYNSCIVIGLYISIMCHSINFAVVVVVVYSLSARRNAIAFEQFTYVKRCKITETKIKMPNGNCNLLGTVLFIRH